MDSDFHEDIEEKAFETLREFDGDELEGDIYFQLAQKERYLIIAAEAGNSLLQKNSELQKHCDVIQEEYSKKIEELENERLLLRKCYQEQISEYETQIHEQILDIKFLHEKISTMEKKSWMYEERREENLKEAIDYSETLRQELNQVASYNSELSFEVKTLKRRIEGRTTSNDDYFDEFAYDDMMETKMSAEQVRRLHQEKKDLEETVSQFASEKILLFENIEKSKNYIASLEQKVKDYQQEISIAQSDLSAVKMSNSQLKDQLEDYIMQASFASYHNNNSLMNELETSLSQSGRYAPENERQESYDENTPNFMSSSPKLKRRNTRASQNSNASEETCFHTAREKQNNDEEKPISSSKQNVNICEQQILELNDKLNVTLKDIDKLSKQHNSAKSQLREAETKVLSLQQQVTQQERELNTLKQEREIILMESVSDALKRSLEDRTEACERENMALLQLDQAKSDMLKLNSQLLEAVQQKLQLSEQLEMWQVDMATLLERQLHSKPSKGKGSGRTSKIFSGRWSWSSNSKLGQQNCSEDSHVSS